MNVVQPEPVADGRVDRQAEDWFKDAVIYQCHVKAYQDSNGDGIGDFKGLMNRLDHIQSLGTTAIWLLPFYPSPLRDDGYDIAEFCAVNPQYGTMEDFEAFVEEAHRRGLKVITELVINHTSDQHEWFQRARRAPKGSPEREFYVWSDDPHKWMDQTRVIFNDTHDSNWAWDPVAEQFYWHRFFDHQPDLNFDNPEVMKAVLEVMHFWLDRGVDGLRLDAIPYLVERDGTNNENLPETHAVLKAIRADLDEHYTGRMLLAEANQWPEDTRPYFGEGDECHMGFHFPLMPRMYMALAQEDRHPITDIIRQTPEIPSNCQWGIFLRNHDELTLEMVTDRERDYLWETYASDKRARINMGIRRRLAPLMQNDRRKIELLNSLLLSMPGTPILYYGDEIGMGDNYYLGDRDGVRTPMQWSPDRNAGFSTAVPQRLYLPTIQDPVHGYQAVNVEAQSQDPSSLLNWMRRMVAVRGQHAVFGRGEMVLLYPRNRRVLAYVRQTGEPGAGAAVLCVANLSRQAQAVEIDLSPWTGRVPIEMTGRAAFPPVGELPYLITLPAYGFYWFELAGAEEAPNWHVPAVPVLPEFLTLTARDGRLSTALSGREAAQFERETLPQFVALQRWFGSKDRRIRGVRLRQLGSLADAQALTVLDVDLGGETESYFMPLAVVWGEDALAPGAPTLSWTLAKLRRGPRLGALVDGAAEPGMAEALMAAMREGRRMRGQGGEIVFEGGDALAALGDLGTPRLLPGEQSNASIAFGDAAMLKVYRRLRAGPQPEIEMARHLTEAGYTHTPAFLGTITWQPEGGGPDESVSLATAFAYVRNQGDAWAYLTAALERDLSENALSGAAPEEAPEGAPRPAPNFDLAVDTAALLGTRTAGMHLALATPTDNPAFAPEPVTAEALNEWAAEARADLDAALDGLARANLAGEAAERAARLSASADALRARLDAAAAARPSGLCTRIHGDYHLGQVLVVQNDVAIIDFEGEPRRSIAERRAKSSPLRDVAGMLRSLDYAAASALQSAVATGAEPEAARARMEDWRRRAVAAFMAAYAEAMEGSPAQPAPEAARALLDLFIIQKAAYELSYELAMRPAWVGIPLAGLASILEEDAS